MAKVIAIVDTGPLYAAADLDDSQHVASLKVLERADIQLAIPALVVAEATYFIGTRLGAEAEGRFLEALATMDVEAPKIDDWPRIAELVRRYGNFPLGGTDASVIALAERLETPVLVSLDHRHFGAVQPRHCSSFQLLP